MERERDESKKSPKKVVFNIDGEIVQSCSRWQDQIDNRIDTTKNKAPAKPLRNVSNVNEISSLMAKFNIRPPVKPKRKDSDESMREYIGIAEKNTEGEQIEGRGFLTTQNKRKKRRRSIETTTPSKKDEIDKKIREAKKQKRNSIC